MSAKEIRFRTRGDQGAVPVALTLASRVPD